MVSDLRIPSVIGMVTSMITLDDQTATVVLGIIKLYARPDLGDIYDITLSYRQSLWAYPRLKEAFDAVGLDPESVDIPEEWPYFVVGSARVEEPEEEVDPYWELEDQ